MKVTIKENLTIITLSTKQAKRITKKLGKLRIYQDTVNMDLYSMFLKLYKATEKLQTIEGKRK